MGSSPSAPTPINPQEMVRAQQDANFMNVSTPQYSLQYDRSPVQQTELQIDYSQPLQVKRQQAIQSLGRALTPDEENVLRQNGTIVTQTGGDVQGARLYESPEVIRQRKQSEALSSQFGDLAGTLAGRLSNVPTSEGLPSYVQGVDTSGMGDYVRDIGIDDYSADANRIEQETYQRAMGLLSPQIERERESLATALANQGIPVVAQAGQRDYGDFLDRTSAAQNEAAYRAIQAGRDEQSRMAGLRTTEANLANQARSAMFGEGLSNAGLQNQARQGEFGERMSSYQAGLQGLAQALAGREFNQPNTSDVFGLSAQMPTIDAMTPMQNEYNAQYQSYANKANTRNQRLGAASQLAMAFAAPYASSMFAPAAAGSALSGGMSASGLPNYVSSGGTKFLTGTGF